MDLCFLWPVCKNFVEISTDGLPECITLAYTEDNGGYVFRVEVTGYKSGLVIIVTHREQDIVSLNATVITIPKK